MFGYIMINPKQLSESDKQRYQAMYCGLCRVLDERHGKVGAHDTDPVGCFCQLLQR